MISGIVQSCTIQFLAKLHNGFCSCIKNAPIPIPLLASHSISNIFSKLGKDNKGAELNFYFKSLNAHS